MQDRPEANEPLEDSELNDEELDNVSGGTSKSGLDSVNEPGDIMSSRLQMKIDRVSKFQSTLSNVIQTSSQASNTITQHMK